MLEFGWRRTAAGLILAAAIVCAVSKNRDSSAFPESAEPLKHNLTDGFKKTFPDPKSTTSHKGAFTRASAAADVALPDEDIELLDEDNDESGAEESDVDSITTEVEPVEVRNDLPPAAPVPSNVDPYTPASIQTTLATLMEEEAALSGPETTPEERLALRKERKFNTYLAAVASDSGALNIPSPSALHGENSNTDAAVSGSASQTNNLSDSSTGGSAAQSNPYTELKEKLAAGQSDQPRHNVAAYLASVKQLGN